MIGKCKFIEISYDILKYYRNKSYTTQAIKLLIKYLFEQTNEKVLSIRVWICNLPSNIVIQKCGFKLYKNIEIENNPFNWYLLSKKNL